MLSQRHPLLYRLAVFTHQQKRRLLWAFDRTPLARSYQKDEKLPHNVKRHSSRLIRKHGDSDLQLQHNKVHNIGLCLPHLDGLLIRPGESFSFCRLVGKPSRKRGFIEGMELSMGEARAGIGGGICQIANMLHWLVLHSPLTVTQRSNHSFDPFPDSKRSIPFGTGCSVFYNYIDFRFLNETDYTFHLSLFMDEENLNGHLTSDRMIELNYKIFEKDHHFTKEGPNFYRHNEIWRKVLLRKGGRHLRDEHIKTNHVRVMYTPEEFIER